MRFVIAILGLSLLVGGGAAAQPRAAMEKRLEELSQKVDEAMKAAADSAAALKALQDLQEQVNALKKEVSAQGKASEGYEQVRTKLHDLDSRLGNMELAQAAMKMQLSQQEATAGFKNGFFVRSGDRKFLLRLIGLLQGGYTGRLFSDELEVGGIRIGQDESTFVFRRARIGMAGHLLNWRLKYHLELDFGNVDPGPLLEGWGELQIHRMLKLRAGRQKIPFGRQFLIHAAYQQFVERSGATQAFAPGWDLGLVLRGDVPLLGIVSYQVGMFNGSRMEMSDDNTDFLYVTRLLYQPLGPIPYEEGDPDISKLKIAIGGAFTYNLIPTDRALRLGAVGADIEPLNDADNDGNVDNIGVYGANAELAMRMGGLGVQSELFYRREDPGAVSADRSFWGTYAQASMYHFESTLELAARYGYWEPSYYGLSREVPRPEQIHEVAVVANALTWGRRVKWQIEYAHQWLQDLAASQQDLGMDLEVDQVRLQMQLAF